MISNILLGKIRSMLIKVTILLDNIRSILDISAVESNFVHGIPLTYLDRLVSQFWIDIRLHISEISFHGILVTN